MKRGKRAAGIGLEVSIGGLVILSLVRESPRSGYDLVKEFELQAVSDWAQISKAQVYQLLGQLERAGFLTASDPEGIHRRSVFTITESGTNALSNQLSNPAWLNDLAPSNFMTWLGLAVHAPEASLRGTMERRRDWLNEQIERKRNVLSEVQLYPSDRAPFGVRLIKLYLAQLQAELNWLESELTNWRIGA